MQIFGCKYSIFFILNSVYSLCMQFLPLLKTSDTPVLLRFVKLFMAWVEYNFWKYSLRTPCILILSYFLEFKNRHIDIQLKTPLLVHLLERNKKWTAKTEDSQKEDNVLLFTDQMQIQTTGAYLIFTSPNIK